MAEVSMSVWGKHTISQYSGTEGGIWHTVGSSGKWAGLRAYGNNVKLTRSSPSNSTVSVSGTCYSTLIVLSGGWGDYNYYIRAALFLGGTPKNVSANGDDTSNQWLDGGTMLRDYGWSGSYGEDCSFNLSTSITLTDNTKAVYLCYYCGQNGDGYTGCSVGYTGTSYPGFSAPIIVGTISASDINNIIPYQPYKTPTISLTGNTYSKHDASRSLNISANTSRRQ